MRLQRALAVLVKWVSLACLVAFSAFECWLMVIAQTGQQMTGTVPSPDIAIQWLFLLSQFAAIAVVHWTRLPLVLVGSAEWIALFLNAVAVKHQALSGAIESTTPGTIFLAVAIVHWVAAKRVRVTRSMMLS